MAQQRVGLVTGCSDPKGLGAALCRQLVHEGFEVYATGRSVERTKFLEVEGCIVLALDISDEQSVKAVLKEVESRSGRLDILINNAAIVASAPLLDMDPQSFRDHFENNVYGTFSMIQASGPLLVRTAQSSVSDGSAPRRTSMVNIGTVQVAFGMPWMGAYGASKAAIQTMTDTLRKEMKPLGVDVINVEMCGAKTPFGLGQRPPDNPISSSPTGFYPNFISYQPRILERFNKSNQSSQTPDAAAKDIIQAAIGPRAPPLKMWAGTPGWLFKYIFGLLPVSFFEGMLMKEQYVKEIVGGK